MNAPASPPVEAAVALGAAFCDISEPQRDELIARLEIGRVETEWPVPPDRFVAAAVRVTAEAYYGPRNSPSWPMIGYRSNPSDRPRRRPPRPPPDDLARCRGGQL